MLLEYEVISIDAGECQRISYKTVCYSSWIPEMVSGGEDNIGVDAFLHVYIHHNSVF